MNTSSWVAVGVAVVVVAVIFIFPGLSPFNFNSSAPASAATTTDDMATSTTSTTTTMTNSDGLQVTDDTVGTGAVAQPGDSVTVNYVGTLADGTVFDASANHGTTGFTFTLGAGQVIPGWDEGIVGMKVGGTRTLVIPPSLAYGSQGSGSAIPPNATITFQVQLLSVTPGQAQ